MPNERNRQTVPQRLAASGRSFLTREYRGARNAVPGTNNWQWQQTLDALALPGNWYNSQAPQGERWQVPGVSGIRNLFGGDNSGQQGEAQGNWIQQMFGIRPGGSQGGQQPGMMASLRNIFGIRSPQPGPNEWGPPSNLAGPDGTTFGPDRSLAGPGVDAPGPPAELAGPAPRGGRPQMNTFMLMQNASAAAAEREYLNMLWAQQRRQK